MLKRVFKYITYIAAFYIVLVSSLFVFQRQLIYHPVNIQAYTKEHLNRIDVVLMTEGDLEWLYLPAYQPSSSKTLVLFHGNAGTAYDRAFKVKPWRQNGFNVVLAEYPGYGTNEGNINENNLYKAARVIVDNAIAEFPDSELYLYGESIGSGVATQMATEYDEKALILEAPFTDLSAPALIQYPFVPTRLLLRDRFDNLSKINLIDAKLYIIHGKQDQLIPISLGRNLYDGYNGDKAFYAIDKAGHNDIYDYANIDRIIKNILRP